MIIGFVIWLLVSFMFFGFGIAAFRAKEPVGFWANAKTPEIGDVKAYNKAVGKLWCVMSVVFLLLGLPLLIAEQNSPIVLFSVIGVMIEMIVVMVIYSLKIEAKYRATKNV